MSRLPRIYQKLFGTNGATAGFGKFGSWADGTKVNTKDLTIIQSLNAFLEGWAEAVKGDNIPTLEELNSLFYLLFSQICYLLEEGIPEWDDETTYYTGCITQVAGVIYRSLQDSNLNKDPTSQPAYWELIFDGSQYVGLTGNENVAGIKTFASFPVGPSSAPSTNYQLANKKYVDDKIVQGSGPASVPLTALPAGNQGPTTVGQEYFYLTMGKDSNGVFKTISGYAGVATPIPLPSGCAQADCHWIVSAKYCYLSGVAMIGFSISIDADRYVTIQTKGNNWVG